MSKRTAHNPIAFALRIALTGVVCLAFVSTTRAQATKPAAKTLIDYFLPMPIHDALTSAVWGAPGVIPRDIKNGLEDSANKQWNYWDGQIIKAADGKFHMFSSRWAQSAGHGGWGNSVAVHSVSDSLFGPYVDKGPCWPDNQNGKGHNVTALTLPDGRFAIIVSETRPGDVFIAKTLDGPYEYQGSLKFDANGFNMGRPTSNTATMLRPDGSFEIIARPGVIMISTDGIMGPYKAQGADIYPKIPGLPRNNLEDPVIWFSGGLYHIVVNCWSERKAYHLTSKDGITNWINQGLAYDPTTDFIRYTDGTVNHWNNMERAGVYLEDGHVAAFTFASIDVPKAQDTPNSGHASKVIVVPFNGKALDQDLAAASATQPATAPTK